MFIQVTLVASAELKSQSALINVNNIITVQHVEVFQESKMYDCIRIDTVNNEHHLVTESYNEVCKLITLASGAIAVKKENENERR